MHLGPARSASPATGVLRGLRATVLAVLCVLLPLAGHALAQGHAPRPVIVAGIAAVAVPGAVTLTRRRLTDAQVLAVLTATQLAYHAAYSLPGACRTTAGSAATPGGLPAAVEHGAAAGPPAGVLLAGHLVTLAVGARLLGITERLLWQSGPLLLAVGHLLLFAWPLTGAAHHQRPRATVRESASPLKSAVLARLNAGRAPPPHGPAPFIPHRPTPTGGPCLP
ncbi:hypothetical protein [Streptomyces sp. NRRL F-5135]|uniref:hypothetical protein n=1 Tax=Streptomyces sp. NRRL F-5135 TaxID=1463858 RepID=UPI0004C494FE|nr:hypothetical protein [Streptomyces sp. NRRL F-5135]